MSNKASAKGGQVELEVPRTWVRLRFALRADGALAVDGADYTGRTVRSPVRVVPDFGWEKRVLQVAGWGAIQVYLPGVIAAWVQHAVREVPESWQGPHGGDPVTVPLFVTPPPGLNVLDWEELIPALLPEVPRDRITVVLDRPKVGATDPFDLPLDVLAVGTAGSAALRAVERHGVWLGGEPAVSAIEHAERCDVRWEEDGSAALAALRTTEVDVMILDAWDAAALANHRPSHPARLAVVLEIAPDRLLARLAAPLPAARSVLSIAGPFDATQTDLVRELFAALSHDRPLHEAASILAARTPGRQVRLHASPESVHDIRLSEAWEGVVRRSYWLAGLVGEGHLSPALTLDQSEADQLANAVRGGQELDVNFERESWGLDPIVAAKANLRLATNLAAELAGRFINTPEYLAHVTGGHRVVNLGLRRTGHAWVPNGTVYMPRTRSLAAGTDYDLDVQIGARWAASLVEGDQEPIDLLLPDSREGHDLDVVVFAADIEARSPVVVRLHLPPTGGTDVGTFRVRTPERPGRAMFRVSVYFRDNLVQTFRFDVLVDEREADHNEAVTIARCEHSATARWENLDDLGPRRLSLTLNQGGPGTHRVYLKGDATAETLLIDSDVQSQQTDKVRKVLVQVVDGAMTSEDALWELAQIGEALVNGLYLRLDRDAHSALSSLAGLDDQLVQIVRLDPHYALPWTIVYDWTLPEVVFGAPRPPVCFGMDDTGEPCGHRATTSAVCARGFWGVRHRVEELIGDPKNRDLSRHVPMRAPAVLVGDGEHDPYTDAFPGDLATALGEGGDKLVRPLRERDKLLDLLFDEAKRPAVLVVVGHHETIEIVGEPTGARIRCGTAERWLRADPIVKRARDSADWDAPNPVILLMACRSAAVRPCELTSFLAALAGVGAGAVIGTECDVYSDLAARFARDVLAAMAGAGDDHAPAPLALAVRDARAALLTKEKDVRGFAFNAFGPAGTSLVRT